jgi:hypothetical protein
VTALGWAANAAGAISAAAASVTRIVRMFVVS